MAKWANGGNRSRSDPGDCRRQESGCECHGWHSPSQGVFRSERRRTSKSTDEGVTEYLYSGENAITETFVPTGAGTPRGTSNLFGDSSDELLAYSSDVSAATPEEASERLFCALRVAPYGQDFSRYGWNALVLRCAGLEDAAGISERKTFAVLSDSLGSPVALTDGSGSTVLEYAYSAFGEAYAKS